MVRQHLLLVEILLSGLVHLVILSQDVLQITLVVQMQAKAFLLTLFPPLGI